MARAIGYRYPTIVPVETNTNEEYKAGTPIRLARGISVKVDRKQDNEEVTSDDTTEDIIYGDEETEITISGNDLTPEVMVTLYGGEIIKGAYVPPSTPSPKEVAYLDEIAMKEPGGSIWYKKRCFFCGKFELFSEDNETKQKKPSPKNVEVKGKFYRRQKDNRAYFYFFENQKDADSTLKEQWFKGVPEVPVNEAEQQL